MLPSGIAACLRCPVCEGGLHLLPEAMRCAGSCGTVYPVIDGIPVLLNEARSLFSREEFVRRGETYFQRKARLIELLDRAVPGTSMNLTARANYRELRRLLQRRARQPVVLVIGGGIPGDGFDELLRSRNLQLVESDIAIGPRTQLVCDAHDLPFLDGSFDGVIAQAVLEHVLEPQRCVAEIHRVLKPGGLVYAETPFMQQVHGGRYDFTRFTLLGHRRLFREFTQIRTGASSGPGQTLAWAIQYFCLGFARGQRSRLLCNALGRTLGAPWKYADRYLVGQEAALDGASGVYFIGARSEQPLPDRTLIAQYRGGEYLAR